MLLERNVPGPNAFISQLPLAGKFANEVGLTSHVKHAIKTSNNAVMEAKAPTSEMYQARLDWFKTTLEP